MKLPIIVSLCLIAAAVQTSRPASNSMALAESTLDFVAIDAFCYDVPPALLAARPQVCPPDLAPTAPDHAQKLQAAWAETLAYLSGLPEKRRRELVGNVQQVLEYLLPLLPQNPMLPKVLIVTYWGPFWLHFRNALRHPEMLDWMKANVGDEEQKEQFMKDFCAGCKRVGTVLAYVDDGLKAEMESPICDKYPDQEQNELGYLPVALGLPDDTSDAYANDTNQAAILFADFYCRNAPATVIQALTKNGDGELCALSSEMKQFADDFWNKDLKTLSKNLRTLHIRLGRNTWVTSAQFVTFIPSARHLDRATALRVWSKPWLLYHGFMERPNAFKVMLHDLGRAYMPRFLRAFCSAVQRVNIETRGMEGLEELKFADCPVRDFVMQPEKEGEEELDITGQDLPIP